MSVVRVNRRLMVPKLIVMIKLPSVLLLPFRLFRFLMVRRRGLNILATFSVGPNSVNNIGKMWYLVSSANFHGP